MSEIKMSNYKKLEKLMKGFASAIRLEILTYIQQGIGNPGEIAKRMNRPRSTIENHLNVLVEADAIKKITMKNQKGQMTISYVLQKNANILLANIKHLLKENSD